MSAEDGRPAAGNGPRTLTSTPTHRPPAPAFSGDPGCSRGDDGARAGMAGFCYERSRSVSWAARPASCSHRKYWIAHSAATID